MAGQMPPRPDFAPMLEHANRPGAKFICGLLLAGAWLHFFSTLPATYEVRLNDFPAYYGAATSIAEGNPAALYGNDFKWFTNLPVVALLLRPLAALTYPEAWKFFWWLQVTSFVATFGLLLISIRKFFAPLSWLGTTCAGAIYLSFAPVMRRCLELGQTTPMMVFVLALVLFFARSGATRIAGALLGLICVIKIPPNLLIVLLVMRRRLQLALPAALVFATALILSIALFGIDLVAQFADRVVLDNLGRSEAAFNNQSLEGALMRIFTDRGLADWTTIARPLPVTLGVLGTTVALAGFLYRRAPGLLLPASAPDNHSLELEVALGVALMLLLFPVVWIHYYLFLAVPLTLLPFFWLARDLPRPAWLVGLLALGLWWASGVDSHENAYYAAREGEWLFRLAQNRQPAGALLLVIGLSFPLAQMAQKTAPD